ncbi:MAG TPA: hypothetical protein DD719_05150 [Desulfotomaculum sp.]|nr:hypothetical protein [Desulfotomaculum sp.]
MFVYYVQPQDTLYLIARRFNTTLEKILALNDLPDPDNIKVGMKLYLDLETEEPEVENDPYTTRIVDGLLYILTTEKARFLRREPILFTLTKLNITSAPVTLNYRSSQRFDFVVLKDNQEIWRWSEDQFFAQVMERISIRPGEAQIFSALWDQRDNSGQLVAPGSYIVRGYNLAEELRRRFIPTTIRIRLAPAPLPPPITCPSDNLLNNPGLENWLDLNTPSGWQGTNLNRTRFSKSGSFAAELGTSPNQRAALTQMVSGLPRRLFRLEFWAREIPQTPPRANFTLGAEVFFYDTKGNFISRADPVFNQAAIPEQYTSYTLTTGLSPAGTVRAEVRFIFSPATGNNSTVGIDDVDFRCLT